VSQDLPLSFKRVDSLLLVRPRQALDIHIELLVEVSDKRMMSEVPMAVLVGHGSSLKERGDALVSTSSQRSQVRGDRGCCLWF